MTPWGAAFDIGPDQVRALDDRRLTDLCRCFAGRRAAIGRLF
jgi:hypothetical protein